MEQQAGAMPRALQNAGQDNRLTRMILRDGAAGPDDLKRMRENGVSGRARTRVHRSSDHMAPGLARSRTLGKDHQDRSGIRSNAAVATANLKTDTSAQPLAAQQTDHFEAGNRLRGFGQKDRLIRSGAVGADSNVGPRFAFGP